MLKVFMLKEEDREAHIYNTINMCLDSDLASILYYFFCCPILLWFLYHLFKI